LSEGERKVILEERFKRGRGLKGKNWRRKREKEKGRGMEVVVHKI